jgi:hypothetical protein
VWRVTHANSGSLACIRLKINNNRGTGTVTYHITKLLVQSVTSSTACLLVRNLGSDPIAEMFLVFFRELSSPVNDVSRPSSFLEQVCNALFPWSSTTRVFVYEWRVYNCTLFDTFLDPQV